MSASKKIATILITAITIFSLMFYFYIHDKIYDGIDANGKSAKVFIYNKKVISLNNLSYFTGQVMIKFNDGNLSKTIDIKDGIRDGVETSYYPSGAIMSKRYMKNNKTDGLTTEFYPTGAMRIKRYMKDGLGNGEIKIWYENGALKLSGQLKNGKQEGLIIEFYQNGNKKREATYIQDMLIKEHFIYRKNGTLWFKSIIKDGKPIKIEEYDEMGNFKSLTNESEVIKKWKKNLY